MDRLRILIIDDYPDAADTLALLIHSWGHVTRVAYHETEALSAARDFQPHIVLVDLFLPERKGADLARTLRQQPGLEKTVMIAVSGYKREVHEEYGASPLFDSWLVKPVDSEELRRVLEAEAAFFAGPPNAS